MSKRHSEWTEVMDRPLTPAASALDTCNACTVNPMAPGQETPDQPGYCLACLTDLLGVAVPRWEDDGGVLVLTHGDECEECMAQLKSAQTMAAVTGSKGATHSLIQSDGTEHKAVWTRRKVWKVDR